jgi:septal ring factor EnvC (AmiA/AmiB activator)
MNIITKLVVILFFICLPIFSYAQTSETQSEKEARLRAELAQVEKEQAETEKVLAAQQGQSASISRDISILNTKIKAAQLNIKAKNLLIESLGKDINRKQDKIEDLEGHITRGKETLGQIMRKNNEANSISHIEFVLSRQNLSQAFLDIDNFQSIESSLHNTFAKIRDDKSQTESEKNTLNTKRRRV